MHNYRATRFDWQTTGNCLFVFAQAVFDLKTCLQEVLHLTNVYQWLSQTESIPKVLLVLITRRNWQNRLFSSVFNAMTSSRMIDIDILEIKIAEARKRQKRFLSKASPKVNYLTHQFNPFSKKYQKFRLLARKSNGFHTSTQIFIGSNWMWQ